MVLEGHLLVGFLNLRVACTLVNTEDLVVIFALGFLCALLSILEFLLDTETSLVVLGRFRELPDGLVVLLHLHK